MCLVGNHPFAMQLHLSRHDGALHEGERWGDDGAAFGDLIERLHDFSGIEEHRVEASIHRMPEVVVAHIR